MRRLSGMTLLLIGLTGCVSQPNLEQLRAENERLEQQLDQASGQISDLRVREQGLREDLSERERVIEVLETEKSSRTEVASHLRSSIRAFVQDQIDSYQDFLLQADLLDYVGGELVERANRSEEESRTLVDLANPMPSSGTLTGMSAHFLDSGRLVVKVLRPIEDELVVIWESMEIEVAQTGVQRFSFPVSVGVEAGDVVAYRFSGPVSVSYDRGTGDTRYQRENLPLGSTVKKKDLAGADEHRAYSIGVFGLLN